MKKLAIIVPCYNEANRLDMAAFDAFTKGHPHVDIYFANDGSKDNTATILSEASANNEQLFFIDFKQNQGKGETVRKSALQIAEQENKTYDWIGFLDADLATPLEEMMRILEEARAQTNLLIGARLSRMGSDINRKWYRHYPGRIVATFISWILGLDIYDTQCGAKWMKPEIIQNNFQEPFMTPWLFDVEMIKRVVMSQGVERSKQTILEIPLKTWIEMGDSRITFTDFLKTPFELLKIYFHYK